MSKTTVENVDNFYRQHLASLRKIKSEKIKSFRHDIYTRSKEYYTTKPDGTSKKIMPHDLQYYFRLGNTRFHLIFNNNFIYFVICSFYSMKIRIH